jgi:S1-C subfamily serine protease
MTRVVWLTAAVVTVAIALAQSSTVRAADDESFESAAETISSATVTVRVFRGERSVNRDANSDSKAVLPKAAESDADRPKVADPKVAEPKAAETKADDDQDGAENRRDARFSVQSGVSLGDGLIVTSLRSPAEARLRVTFVGGRRAKAELRVVDENSSLALLEVERKDLPRVEFAASPPKIGGRLIVASAWGTEPPAVSLGVLGGVDRFVAGGDLPPLVQCDVRTTVTSAGAGVVDRNGKLVGIVALTDAGDRTGWVYALSADHVRRLVAARRAGELVTIPRRRPFAGIELRQAEGADAPLVRHVVPGGPAAASGILAGD